MQLSHLSGRDWPMAGAAPSDERDQVERRPSPPARGPRLGPASNVRRGKTGRELSPTTRLRRPPPLQKTGRGGAYSRRRVPGTPLPAVLGRGAGGGEGQ